MIEKNNIEIAVNQFGLCVVEEVVRMLKITNIDDLFELYVNREMFTHLDCLEMISK